MKHIRRYAAVLAGLIGTITVLGVGAPAAFAEQVMPGGGGGSPAGGTVTRIFVPGGMPGWQIALIAVGSALIAAVGAVVLDRTRQRRLAVLPA